MEITTSYAHAVSERVPSEQCELFNNGEHLIGIHSCSFCDANLNDVAGFWRFDFVLHLHSFHYNDALT